MVSTIQLECCSDQDIAPLPASAVGEYAFIYCLNCNAVWSIDGYGNTERCDEDV